ncbi:MAG TPA: glycosyltransferase [Acidimicrobiales bacterium]|nr:glycosyltransferase [Acidimicrobiales bacterium]
MAVGGIETNLVRLVRALTRRGHVVLVAARPGALTAEISDAGGRLIPLKVRPRSLSAVFHDRRILRAELAAADPDVIHVFSASAAVLTTLARWPRFLRRRHHHAPVISTVMGLDSAADGSPLLTLARVAVTAVGSTRMIIVSPAIGETVRRLPIPRSRLIHGLVAGVEVPADEPTEEVRLQVRRELGLPAGCRLVLTIGNLEARKSHELFIAAADLLVQDGVTAVFAIVGEGYQRAELELEIQRRSLEGRVRLLGERRDIIPLLAACDVYVRPGVVEGFVGITVLEAQSIGIPVVGFDTLDLREAIEQDVSGLLVPNRDIGGMARAIRRLLDDPELRRRLGRAGRDMVRSKFSLQTIVDNLESLYQELAGRRGPADEAS